MRQQNDDEFPLLALAHETVLRERFLEIILPRCIVRVRVRVEVPISNTKKKDKSRERNRHQLPTKYEQMNGKTHLLIYDCVGNLSGSHP